MKIMAFGIAGKYISGWWLNDNSEKLFVKIDIFPYFPMHLGKVAYKFQKLAYKFQNLNLSGKFLGKKPPLLFTTIYGVSNRREMRS